MPYVDGDEDNMVLDDDVDEGNEINEQQEWSRTVDGQLTPYLGQVFKTVDEAVDLYSKYALACGFDVRRYSETKWRDNTIKTKLLVCRREGACYTPRKEAVGTEEAEVTPKRKCKFTRVGCKARVRLFSKGGCFVVDRFHEGHNHELISADEREFQKGSRDLSQYHKELIVQNSRLAIGATKTFKMCKEHVNGFENVGAGLNDFKNFHRDVKCFLHGRDGQMFIDHFKNMAANREGFYFDYDVDENNCLSRAIWADRTARRNYEVFGDAVSYDPTYKTNMYSMVFSPFTGVDNHMHSVTFCGALLAHEDHESFEWVFSRFLIAMGGKEPEYLITDQDPGLIKAFPLAFKTARHRFCAWHIMNKLPVKYGSGREDCSVFFKKVSGIVWDQEITGSEFDCRWREILEEHDTSTSAEWFEDTFGSLKSQWVMAHCRDLRMGGVMKTTQRSESENSFFKRFESKSGTLVEFWMRFESAMDQQRYTQRKLDNESRHSDYRKISQFDIEVHAGKLYTHEVFKIFQEELQDSMGSCIVRGFRTENGCDVTTVKDTISGKLFEVKCNPDTLNAGCTCKLFERFGILCRHILWIFSGLRVKNIPEKYVLQRWTKDALRSTDEGPAVNPEQAEFTRLWSEVRKTICVLRGGGKEDITRLCNLIKDFRLEISPEGEPLSKQQVIEQLLGVQTTGEVTILPPKHSKNKGGGKRLLSSRTKAIFVASKPLRMCANCKKKSTHDKRNCPLLLKSKPGVSDKSSESGGDGDDLEGEETLSD